MDEEWRTKTSWDRMTLRLEWEVGCGNLDSRIQGWTTEITGGYVRRGERRLGRWWWTSGEWMGRVRGDGIVRSGPRVNASLREIDRSRRNLNTREKVMIGRCRRVVGQLTKSRSKEWFGTRDSRCSYMEERGGGCWERPLMITDRGGCRHGLLETEDKSSVFRCSGHYVDRPR